MINIGIYGNNLNQGYFLAQLFCELGVEAKVMIPFNSHPQDKHDWWTREPLDENLIIWFSSPVDSKASGFLSSQAPIFDIYKTASQFDVLLLREDGPALFSELKGPSKVFASQGADLQQMPWFLKALYSPKAIIAETRFNWLHTQCMPLRVKIFMAGRRLISKARSYPMFARGQMRQRKGIMQCARAIIFPYQSYLLKALDYPEQRIRYVPVPNTPPDILNDQQIFASQIFNSNYKRVDIMFIHPARMFFLHRNGDRFLKDNDKLLFAFERFVRYYKGETCLVLFEKGLNEDLNAAKAIIKKLDMGQHIIWLPELTNQELRAILRLTKVVVCDQFSPFLNALGNLGRESVYFGRPLITSYDGEDNAMYTSPPPNVFLGNSVLTIFSAMKNISLMKQNDLFKIKQECSEWYRLNLNPLDNAKRYLDICYEALLDSEGGA